MGGLDVPVVGKTSAGSSGGRAGHRSRALVRYSNLDTLRDSQYSIQQNYRCSGTGMRWLGFHVVGRTGASSNETRRGLDMGSP